MNNKDIISFRMENQGLSKPVFNSIEEVVRWMGCIQAQDFHNAKWGIGMRIPGCTEAIVDDAFNTGKMLRTHVLRPTWHFVLPEDIRWILKLTTPRTKLLNQYVHRKLDIDDAALKKSKKILIKALEGRTFLNRIELKQHFQKEKLNTNDIRITMLLMDAELDGLICSGPRKGKQFTYALLDEVASNGHDLNGDAALIELAQRFFISRGPATVQDFAWWSGLTLTQARKGLGIIKNDMENVIVNGQEYWFANNIEHKPVLIPAILLLPDYDEYVVSYSDRSMILSKEHEKLTFSGLKQVIVYNGKVSGMWKRTIENGKLKIEAIIFTKITKKAIQQLNKEIKKYAAFIGREEPTISIQYIP